MARRKAQLRPRFVGALALLAAAAAAVVLLEPAYRVARHVARCGLRPAPAKDVFTLYTIGESTPAGEPFEYDVSLPYLVARMFRGRLGGRPIEVVNLAVHGETIYPQAQALEQALECRQPGLPAAVLIYSGNNDEGGRFHTPALEFVKEEWLDQSALLRDALFALQRSWRPARVYSLQTYEYQLRRAVELSLAHGVVPILSTVASNASGIDPPLIDSNGESREEIRRLLDRGQELENRGKLEQAVSYYRKLGEERPYWVNYLRYRIARSRLAQGRYAAAKLLFQDCVDLTYNDNYHRATRAQNDFIRRLGRERGVPVTDSVRILEDHSPHRIIGNSLMADGHHPNMTGHLLIAEGYARALGERFHEAPSRRFSGPPEVFKEFGYDGPRLSKAFQDSGRWWFSVAEGQLYQDQRLAMAKERFSQAVAADPRSVDARVGAAIVDSARRGFLFDHEAVDLLNTTHFFYEAGPADKADMEKLLLLLQSSGTPAREIEGIRRLL